MILLILTLLVIPAFDTPRLVRERLWRELVVYFMLWTLGSFLAVAVVAGIELPNPVDLITAVFGPR
jgi:hypothetical protein